jgi:hypothetical protein
LHPGRDRTLGTTTERDLSAALARPLPFDEVVLVREEFVMMPAELRDPSFVLTCAAIAMCLAVVWWAFELGPF